MWEERNISENTHTQKLDLWAHMLEIFVVPRSVECTKNSSCEFEKVGRMEKKAHMYKQVYQG